MVAKVCPNESDNLRPETVRLCVICEPLLSIRQFAAKILTPERIQRLKLYFVQQKTKDLILSLFGEGF